MRRASSKRHHSVLRWLWLVILLLGWGGWREWQQPSQDPRQVTKVFQVLLDARLHPHRDNDGDSFHLEHSGQVHEFRLYFADCPEKRRHPQNGGRLADQGRYFGGLSEAQTVALGQKGEAFTREWLSSQRFTVCTKWHSVYGSGRYYAFILFPDGEDLSAKLVRAGLARIHTGGTTLPDGREARVYEQQLRQMEAEARRRGLGGWMSP
jgi:endonuclease YncB( thermonuclease family)